MFLINRNLEMLNRTKNTYTKKFKLISYRLFILLTYKKAIKAFSLITSKISVKTLRQPTFGIKEYCCPVKIFGLFIFVSNRVMEF